MRHTTPSTTVKSNATRACPRWNHAAPGRSAMKTDSAAAAPTVEEVRHLLPPVDAIGRADQDRGLVGGHHRIRREQSQQTSEIAFPGGGEERVDHLPVSRLIPRCWPPDLAAGTRSELAGCARRGVEHGSDSRRGHVIGPGRTSPDQVARARQSIRALLPLPRLVGWSVRWLQTTRWHRHRLHRRGSVGRRGPRTAAVDPTWPPRFRVASIGMTGDHLQQLTSDAGVRVA